MEKSNAILSDVTVFNKYAKYLPEAGRRESWFELVTRNMNMHINMYKHIDGMEQQIRDVYEYVYAKKVLPSMRSLQFGGRPIELAHNRIYNCAYVPVDDIAVFSEMMFLLLGGTGGGYSVQKHHVDALPTVQGTLESSRRFMVGDSIEGWADAIKVLVESHFHGKSRVRFDVSDIRPKGAELITTGGKAPGPEPLKKCLNVLEARLDLAKGRKLTTLEAHDMICIIANAVLAGGIRRAALIALFDRDDESMLTCKSGTWWEKDEHRGRANNSAVLPRGEVTQAEFYNIMKMVEDSGCGEPGVYWTSNKDWGTNPCCEIGLRPNQFCNLCEINASDITDQDDLNARAWAAAFIGTLQAGYTDFHYLREVWKETTEKDALIGVGMTGIGSDAVATLDLRQAATRVIQANQYVANKLGINEAARTTTVKPSGTSSLVVGSPSGVHAAHNDFYVRTMRAGWDEALCQYMLKNAPRLVEVDQMNPAQAVLSFPQKAMKGAILRTEPMGNLLSRVRRFNTEWVRPGHVDGDNTHNVSCTISVKDDEWEEVSTWMWENRNDYNGISVLPYDGGTYVQAPFQDITEAEYEKLLPHLNGIVIADIEEIVDNTDLSGEVACGGNGCEVS
jgi:ribonucleoside-triphosphate reductase